MSKIKAKVVKIGNSKGIRIPKLILAQCNIDDEVELESKNDCIIIKSSYTARQDWGTAFKDMRTNNDDVLLVKEELSEEWDDEEWEW